jgi:hypothetical protein
MKKKIVKNIKSKFIVLTKFKYPIKNGKVPRKIPCDKISIPNLSLNLKGLKEYKNPRIAITIDNIIDIWLILMKKNKAKPRIRDKIEDTRASFTFNFP